ncbi:MAG: excinuclease ABC subunit UvrC [Bacteroidetes bacterium]|nr:MAG: excinuclease ABC subunit UvrC [Bacteroidota bacterium]
MSGKLKITSVLLNIAHSLPENPGVYQYFDKHGKIIYIGKAKNLKKRVSSYFTKNHPYGKLLYLVHSIADIKYIVVSTELDALLLENNLIKKYQPRYNVALKDDKTYPWICIKNERFPRVFQTRNFIRDGSHYFGPYTSLKTMYTILDLIKKLYPLRNCTLNLSKENIENKKFRVCLEYHLKNCLGPCEALQSQERYDESISQIRQVLKGNIASVIRQLKELMWAYSGKFDFENAQLLKEKIKSLEKYQSRSVIVSPAIEDADVFSIITDDAFGYVNYLKVVNGAIVQAHTIEMKKKLDESKEELLLLAIAELRHRFSRGSENPPSGGHSETKEIIVPFELGMDFANVEFTIPQIGDKKKLLDLSMRNAEYYRKEKENRDAFSSKEKSAGRILNTMMNDLRLKDLPVHIECFDNSNIQGSFPVSACVVFKNAKPSKKDYRIFHIKTVEGPDDFASMEEVIYRRYKRLAEEKQPLPQLIIIDGGKGQLSSAVKSLEKLSLGGQIAVIGIAKKLEELYYPGDSLPLYLNKKSETLRIIQQMRDEAHRFGLKHHRGRRIRETIVSELTAIKGISDKTAEKLLQEFKSVTKVKETTEEKIAEIIGKEKAKNLIRYFKDPL